MLRKNKDISCRTSLESVARDFCGEYEGNIILAKVGGKLKELLSGKKWLQREFITTGEKIGYQTYTRTATMLMTKAVEDVIGQGSEKNVSVYYSLEKGFISNFIPTFI